MRARHGVVLATGSEAVLPDIDGLDRVGAWTSADATTAEAVPGRLVVIGGGVVACEAATAWRSLGAEGPAPAAAAPHSTATRPTPARTMLRASTPRRRPCRPVPGGRGPGTGSAAWPAPGER
ncbi:FAD-dependent oxidoreductase [Streptomyces vinaceus]|uniref:FAD-dependent oxidoreductase n=1 Tax=Streptomyces vinaceus TaxID=1960 RepID=UPI003802E480